MVRLNSANGGDGYPWLHIMEVVLLALQGAFNSIIYGLNPLVRTRIKAMIMNRRVETVQDVDVEPFLNSSAQR